MKKIFFTIFIFSLNLIGQNKFERGYFIDNYGKKIECLIQNNEWYNNPSKFNYKLTESSEIRTHSLSSSKEFCIIDKIKFVKFAVEIDKSDNSRISNTRLSNFEKDTIFLKTLVEGYYSLFQYKKNNLQRFFALKKGNQIEQLEYKLYKVSPSKINKNKIYIKQINDFYKCKGEQNINNKLKYTSSSLHKYFVELNKCSNKKFINYYKIGKSKQEFHLFFRPGLLVNNSNATNNINENFKLDKNFNFRLGIELEYVVPYDNRKWSIILEPTYFVFNNKQTVTNNRSQQRSIVINYSTITIPMGIRRYFFVNENSKFYINGSYSISSFKLKDLYQYDKQKYPLVSFTSYMLGIGYRYSNYSLELSYRSFDELIPKSKTNVNLSSFALIFSYKLF